MHSVRQDIEIVKEEEKFDMVRSDQSFRSADELLCFAQLLDFIARMDADDKAIVFVDRKST